MKTTYYDAIMRFIQMNSHIQQPLYISKPSARSLWQEYRVYPDRLELRFWIFFKILIIPIEKIVGLKVVSSGSKKKEKHPFMAWFWGLFLDWAAFQPHVMLETKSYFARYIHFSPDNPENFVSAFKSTSRQN